MNKPDQRTVLTRAIKHAKNNNIWVYVVTGLLVANLIVLIIFTNNSEKQNQQTPEVVATQTLAVVVQERIVTATAAQIIIMPLKTVTPIPTETPAPTFTPWPTVTMTPDQGEVQSPYRYNQTYAASYTLTAAPKSIGTPAPTIPVPTLEPGYIYFDGEWCLCGDQSTYTPAK